MGKRPRAKSPGGIQPTAMKALRAQGVSLEVIAGASRMDVADVERILGQEELCAQERGRPGWGMVGWNFWKQQQDHHIGRLKSHWTTSIT